MHSQSQGKSQQNAVAIDIGLLSGAAAWLAHERWMSSSDWQRTCDMINWWIWRACPLPDTKCSPSEALTSPVSCKIATSGLRLSFRDSWDPAATLDLGHPRWLGFGNYCSYCTIMMHACISYCSWTIVFVRYGVSNSLAFRSVVLQSHVHGSSCIEHSSSN